MGDGSLCNGSYSQNFAVVRMLQNRKEVVMTSETYRLLEAFLDRFAAKNRCQIRRVSSPACRVDVEHSGSRVAAYLEDSDRLQYAARQGALHR